MRRFPQIGTDVVALLDEWAVHFFEELDYVHEVNWHCKLSTTSVLLYSGFLRQQKQGYASQERASLITLIMGGMKDCDCRVTMAPSLQNPSSRTCHRSVPLNLKAVSVSSCMANT